MFGLITKYCVLKQYMYTVAVACLAEALAAGWAAAPRPGGHLDYNILYYTILYYPILYFPIFSYPILSYTILYCTLLYYNHNDIIGFA